MTVLQFAIVNIFGMQIIPIETLDMKRGNEIARLLPDLPRGIGNNYKDRGSWDRLYSLPAYKKVVEEADRILKDGFPVWDKSLYNRKFTHGDTQSGKNMINDRLKCLSILVWAECLENNGRFVEIIHDALYDIMKQNTWVNPTHYNEENYDGLVELATALNASCMSQAVYLLDDKLSSQVRIDLIASLYKRAFCPLFETLKGKNNYHWWLTGTNNWNAVCLEGVTTAALTLLSDKVERAKFIVIAERYSKNFIAGFLDDGYCTEGMSYYNFGIGHYNALREIICQNTDGKIDLFEENLEKMYKIAEFPLKMEIVNNKYPAIGDSYMGDLPSPSVLYYFKRTLGLEVPKKNCLSRGTTTNLTESVMIEFPLIPAKTEYIASWSQKKIRSYFDNAGVLIARSNENENLPYGVALKGGNNNEHHNHNDLGSYTLVVGREMMTEDPGLVPYNIKTFSYERYTAFKTLASFGHSVPLIAGKQQIEGPSAEARILTKCFTESKDVMKMDLSSAYKIEGLNKLTREFIFNRNSFLFLEVIDDFVFSEPADFETAIITRANWEIVNKNQILLKRNNQKVWVNIDAYGADFEINNEEITEKGQPYVRLAIKLREKTVRGIVKVTYTKAD